MNYAKDYKIPREIENIIKKYAVIYTSKFYKALYGYMLKEDMYEELVFKARMTYLSKCPKEKNYKSYIQNTIRNKTIDLIRTKNRRVQIACDLGPDFGRRDHKADTIDLIESLLQSLTDEEKILLAGKEAGYSNIEITEALGNKILPQTLKSRVSRVRKKLEEEGVL